jgi:uncharacterized membrane protein
VRRLFRTLGIGAFVASALAAGLASIFAIDRFGAWPMLIPLALTAVGVVALIFYAAHTALSNDAVRRAEAWRAFRAHLREIARDRGTAPADDTLRDWLPYAVAAGLAPAWAAYMKRHRGIAPQWFRALANQDSGASFASLVAVGGPSSGGHHGAAGAGAAAGGGSSGAH